MRFCRGSNKLKQYRKNVLNKMWIFTFYVMLEQQEVNVSVTIRIDEMIARRVRKKIWNKFTFFPLIVECRRSNCYWCWLNYQLCCSDSAFLFLLCYLFTLHCVVYLCTFMEYCKTYNFIAIPRCYSYFYFNFIYTSWCSCYCYYCVLYNIFLLLSMALLLYLFYY